MMKFKGEQLKGTNQEIIPILRPGGDIIFVADAVQDWKEFDELVTEPTPPEIIKPGGVKLQNKNDPTFIKALDEYNNLKTSYLILASLQNTPDMEWETVDMKKSDTWKNYRQELLDSDFTEIEVGRIVIGVMRANSLDEGMIDEARAHFLHGKQGSEKLP